MNRRQIERLDSLIDSIDLNDFSPENLGEPTADEIVLKDLCLEDNQKVLFHAFELRMKDFEIAKKDFDSKSLMMHDFIFSCVNGLISGAFQTLKRETLELATKTMDLYGDAMILYETLRMSISISFPKLEGQYIFVRKGYVLTVIAGKKR